MDNSKKPKFNFNKMFLKETSIIIIGFFLFNTIFADLAWAYSLRDKPEINSFLRQTSVGANKHIQREITGAIIKGLDKEELEKFIEKEGQNIEIDTLKEEFKIISSLVSNEELLKKQKALFDLADKLGIDKNEMLKMVIQARNDLLEENRKVLKHFPDIVRSGNNYGLGLGTEKYLGYGREIFVELQNKCNLRAELLYHEALCYHCEKLKETEGHQIARQIQMVLFPQNYEGIIAREGDSRPELAGKLT